MVALLHPETFETARRENTRSSAHSPSGTSSSVAAAPHLRVIEGGATQTSRPVNTVAMAAGALLVMLFVLFRLVQGAPPASSWEGLADVAYGAEASAAAAVPGPAPVLVDAENVRIVVEGDTLWAIAMELAPDRDPQVVVGVLAARNGGTGLQVGQRLIIPAELS